jgi:hypothetical protein
MQSVSAQKQQSVSKDSFWICPRRFFLLFVWLKSMSSFVKLSQACHPPRRPCLPSQARLSSLSTAATLASTPTQSKATPAALQKTGVVLLHFGEAGSVGQAESFARSVCQGMNDLDYFLKETNLSNSSINKSFNPHRQIYRGQRRSTSKPAINIRPSELLSQCNCVEYFYFFLTFQLIHAFMHSQLQGIYNRAEGVTNPVQYKSPMHGCLHRQASLLQNQLNQRSPSSSPVGNTGNVSNPSNAAGSHKTFVITR